MTIAKNSRCPLCDFYCETDQIDGYTIFRCPHCYTFGISQEAMAELTNVSLTHRSALMLDVWQAHLTGKVLLVTLSPNPGYPLFNRVRVDPTGMSPHA